MKDLKLILGVIGGSIFLLVMMILGLTRMSSGGGALPVVDQGTLISGALISTESGVVKVTVVDFSDMQCPSCKSANDVIKTIRSLPGVRLVFRHFPLGIHANSQIGARAVEAARQMGKSWEMIDILFDKQDEWASLGSVENKFGEYAKSLNLDEKVFLGKINSEETIANVKKDSDLADSLKLSGTPSIFVNGEQTATSFIIDKVNEGLKK